MIKGNQGSSVRQLIQLVATIGERYDNKYTLIRAGSPEKVLSRGERVAARRLFQSRDRIVLENANHKEIGGAKEALGKRLAAEHEKVYFVHNKAYFIPGIVLSVFFVLVQVLLGKDIAGGLFMTVWLSGWTAGCTILGYAVYAAWKEKVNAIIRTDAGAWDKAEIDLEKCGAVRAVRP